jgi:hypothetical protein
MKKVMFSTFVAAVLMAGTSFAQNQKASNKAPVKNLTAPVATAQARDTKETKVTPTKETKTTEPAKKATTPAKK